MPAPISPQSLLPVKNELDRALACVDRDCQAFFETPGSPPALLESAGTELRHVRELLQSLGQHGLVVFCSELGTLLEELAADTALATAMHRNVIRQALSGLTRYLDALVTCAPSAALLLFPEYQALRQARGLEMAFELDLFFPQLDAELPPELLQKMPPANPQAQIKQARMHFQQGLLQWLRQENTGTALRTMRGALKIIEQCVPPPQRRFWWVAQGMLDCACLDGIPPEFNIRKAFSRIDQRIRTLLEDSKFDEDTALNEMLYLIARAHTVSAMVEQIKQRFDLDACLPPAPSLAPDETAAVLDKLRAQLVAANETWEQCVSNHEPSCPRFAQQTERLNLLASQLDRNTLQFLAGQINAAATTLKGPEEARAAAMDMAIALLLLGSGIEHYQRLAGSFHEQAGLVVSHLRHQAGSDESPRLITLYSETEQRDAVGSLCTAMQDNLQQIEQILHAFFDDAAHRTELPQVGRMLAQIKGGLHILSQVAAEHVLASLHQLVEHYQQDGTAAAAEIQAATAAFGVIGLYLQGLGAGQEPDPATLGTALNGLEQVSGGHAAESIAAEEGASAAVPVRTDDEDAELLEVFLEEAQEAMETLLSNLEFSRLHPDNREPWVTMRRAFHTLKGSGRMVGLTELGEVAWAVERAMNKWLATGQPAAADLLKLVDEAEKLFQHWVDTLKKGNLTAHIDATRLLAMADRIEHGEPLPSSGQSAVSEPVPTVAEPPAPVGTAAMPGAQDTTTSTEGPPVLVGTVSLSPSLFHIASEEALEHAQALSVLMDRLQDSTSPVITRDFMRAAHTLAGVNRTMGFLPIAELAFATEQWLEPRIDRAGAIGTAQLVLLDDVITTLNRLCAGVRNLEAPDDQPELIARLAQDKSLAGMAVPVEQKEGGPGSLGEADKGKAAPHEARRVQDEVDEQLLPIFLEEAHELYPRIGDALRAWREKPDDTELGHTLQRSLHTLKGSARMAGAMRLGELTHRVEDRINKAILQGVPGETFWHKLDHYLDRIGSALDQLDLSRAGAADQAAQEAAVPAPEEGAERPLHATLLRVRSDTIDRLVNDAGEISVTRSRAEAELREFRNAVLELTDSVNRMRTLLREIEIQAESQMQARVAASGDSESLFDPLEFDRFTRLQELSRFMNESVHDVQTVQQTLLVNLDETAAALNAQARLNRDLQQDLMSIRMVPFSSISERLYRVVRQTAKELGKRANLELAGAEIELDRSMLEKMTAPFEHLLRNAVAHGIEPPEQRTRLGKAAIGEIRLSLRQDNNEVVFELADDGAGLDLARIRQKAIEMNLVSAGEKVGDDQLAQLIFGTGFTTAEKVTEIAGRGIGLDVAYSETSALGGRIDVASQPGRGTRFTLHLPMTLAVTRTLMVRAAQSVYALPSSMVEHVQQVKPAELDALYAQQHIMWQGKRYPMFYLPRILGDDQAEVVSQPHNPLLLLRSGEQHIALHVDGLLGNQEIVVKNIGPQLARLPGIAGATVSASGEVILIINPIAFVQRIAVARKIAQPEAAIEAVQRKPLVMVVDDSLTVRKITARLLERSGYQVATARDGVDAMEQLMETIPDIMLLDIEMPRMDGFEVVRRLRQDDRTRKLPIIMITSRTADKHRNYALELGVNEYLGKPYQEEDLLGHIGRFIGRSQA